MFNLNGGVSMLAEVKKCAESNDIKGLHYIFVDCLDVDPTFEKYKDDYEYCKKISAFLEPHSEMTPFLSRERWNKQYWEQLKLDLMKNFSEKRFSHMREVARVIYSDKIDRLNQERNTKVKSTVQPIVSNTPKVSVNTSVVSGADEQAKQLLEKKRALELHNQQIEIEQREQRARIEAAKQVEAAKKYNTVGVESPKKLSGVMIAVLAVLAIIVVVVLFKVL